MILISAVILCCIPVHILMLLIGEWILAWEVSATRGFGSPGDCGSHRGAKAEASEVFAA